MDNTKIAFSSEWDVDQIAYSGETHIVVPGVTYPVYSTNIIYTFPAEFDTGGVPAFWGCYQIDGETIWREFGSNELFLHANAALLYVQGARWGLGANGITVRWYVINDKVDY